jgi:hypothetical protein
MKKSSLSMAVVASILFLLCSCAPKAGVLRGKLVDENGKAPASEYTVVLCTVNPDNDTCRLNSRYQTTTIRGEFEMSDVPVGQYGVYVISYSTGIGTLLLRDEGRPLVIQLEKGTDFDLGTIRLLASSTQ